MFRSLRRPDHQSTGGLPWDLRRRLLRCLFGRSCSPRDWPRPFRQKGHRTGIVPNAIETMNAQFGSVASDLIVQLSPVYPAASLRNRFRGGDCPAMPRPGDRNRCKIAESAPPAISHATIPIAPKRAAPAGCSRSWLSSSSPALSAASVRQEITEVAGRFAPASTSILAGFAAGGNDPAVPCLRDEFEKLPADRAEFRFGRFLQSLFRIEPASVKQLECTLDFLPVRRAEIRRGANRQC